MTTLDDVLVRTHQRILDLAPVDVADNLDHFRYDFTGNEVLMRPLVGEDRPLLMHDLALRQVASRVGVPIDYLRRCPPGLAAMNVNYWVQHGRQKQQALIRTIRGNQVRAVLSEAYTQFDDADVLPMVADVLGEEECQVQFADFAGDYTNIRILFPRTTSEVRVGDAVQCGIHISNSEVGMRALRIEALVFRLICLNGAVKAETGTSPENSRSLLEGRAQR